MISVKIVKHRSNMEQPLHENLFIENGINATIVFRIHVVSYRFQPSTQNDDMIENGKNQLIASVCVSR